MYAEGETELRDSIIQNLESSGFLNKIKAELRAGVFIAFEDEGKLKTKNPLANNKFEEFIETSDGKLVVSMVREFLEYFNLNYTLSVFDPESSTSCLNRADLCEKLNLKSSEVQGPVLSALLKTDSITTGKESKKQSNGANSSAPPSTANSLNSKKSLETISEDIAVRENSKDLSKTFDVINDNPSTKSNTDENNKTTLLDTVLKNTGSGMIDKLRKEHHSLELNKKESSVSDIFGTSKSDTNDIFKLSTSDDKLRKEHHSLELNKKESSVSDIFGTSKSDTHNIFKVSTSDDLDTFFDEPLPSQKTSIFGETALGISSNESKPSSKFLPAIEKPKIKDSTFDSELLDALSSLKSAQKKETDTKSEAESNEESSDQQLNSEGSIEEEIEENFSEGIDDLLNSSLSLGDDATTDQSASQVSIVDGVDHIESVAN
ncbi:hypothetical protein JTE90_002054 [Oedothorax gibbosus]|uniref:FGFR1 oncogene partner (FOP) N-terminal dimerisation domain-containing protein n=1 Tax=Oedothorax gibbosus TaxID=931172 RepID=A0AAV6UFR1_9ARAC|nr:hypothetical protein JTE90_002054 [Oedothorax gibbosus]